MNKRLTLLTSPIIMLVASTTIAHAQQNLIPYLGVDAQWRHMNFRKGFGDNLFRHDYQQGNVYTGIKFWNAIGIEVGYEATNKTSRNNLLNPGDLSAGVILSNPIEYRSTIHIKGPHINLVGFIPIHKPYEFRLIGSVGIARPKFTLIRHVNLFYDDGLPFPPITLGQPADTTFEQRKNVLRLGLGLEHQCSERWGLRGMVIWENTHTFKMFGKENVRPSINVKNSVSYSLGAFVNF